MLYRILNGLVAIPALAHLQPAAVLTRGSESRYRQIQCRTNTYCRTFFPSAVCLWKLEHISCWCLPAAARQLQGSTVHHHTDVDACQPCFYPLHCTVFIRFVCSAVWRHCFRVVHLDPSPLCDTARPSSWHLPGKREANIMLRIWYYSVKSCRQKEQSVGRRTVEAVGEMSCRRTVQ